MLCPLEILTNAQKAFLGKAQDAIEEMHEILGRQKLLHDPDLAVLGGTEAGRHTVYAVAAAEGTAHGAEGVDGVGVQGRREQAVIGVGLVHRL